MPAPFPVAILTVSDTASNDASTDRTGPQLKALLQSAEHARSFEVAESTIVPDDVRLIQGALERWSTSGRIRLCITTGGTGFSPRDVTPEAVRPLIVREATGLQHLMLRASLDKTPMAALGRPVAGITKDGMVVVTLPGSPKGALENLEALLGVLPHALDLASGGSGVQVHNAMGVPSRGKGTMDQQHHSCSHSHSHSHTHGHHAPQPRTLQSMDPAQGASGRLRVSQYPIISLEEAYALILDNTSTLGVERRSVDEELVGSILAEDVYSPEDLPSTMTTNVDGYAVSASSTPAGVYPVLTPVNYPYPSAGASILDSALPAGHIYRINTGAPLPLGSDAVIMVEDTELVSETSGSTGKEEKEVKLLAQVEKGENVRMPGSDVRKGDRVLDKGMRITEFGGEVGTLAFVGKREVNVYRRPVVAIMSTGNEITSLHASNASLNSDFPVIYDSNRPSLHGILRSHGFKVVDLGIVPDDEAATVRALRLGCERADVIVTTGGTSMGEGDLLKPVIERNLGGLIHFGRVAMKPGKPTTFATVSLDKSRSERTKVFALPGNPASALVTFHLFVLPCLRKLSGYPEGQWHLPTVKVQTTSAMRLDPRPEFHRVAIEAIAKPPYLIARSTGGQRSSRTVSLAGANGLVCLPSGSAPGTRREIAQGEIVDAILMGRLG